MSSWIVLTLHGRKSMDYAFSRGDNHDRWDATADIYATALEDGRVRDATVGNSSVYAYLTTNEVENAEELLRDYAPMLHNAVILQANDTTDTGTAHYYPIPTRDNVYCSHRYAETQDEDGTHVGQVALASMTANHDIIAADPFHNRPGRLDNRYAEDGEELSTLDAVYNR